MEFKINREELDKRLEARLSKLLKGDKKMITLEELKRDKEALEEKFRLYEKQQKTEVKETYELEYPKYDEDIWWIDSEYEIAPWGFYDSFAADFEHGNVFFTEEEAELEVKRRKLMTRFNQFRDKCNGDWKPDFRENDSKFFISSLDDVTGCVLEVSNKLFVNPYAKFGYFKNEDDCQQAIELFGDKIKELF